MIMLSNTDRVFHGGKLQIEMTTIKGTQILEAFEQTNLWIEMAKQLIRKWVVLLVD